MSEISVIAGVSPGAIRLLEAAGVRRIDNLARQDVTKLFRQLEAINAQRSWMDCELTIETVGHWIRSARTVVSGPLRQGQALAISSGNAGDLNINLDEVPEVIILDDSKHGSVQASAPAPEEAPAPRTGETPGTSAAEPVDPWEAIETAVPIPVKPTVTASHDPSRHQPSAKEWKEVGKERFRDFSAYAQNEAGIRPLNRASMSGDDAIPEVVKIPTVAPRPPSPRRIRRGVPHPRPYFVLFGALIVLASRLLFLAALIGTPIALVPAFIRGDTHTLMLFLWVIGAWLFACILYVLVALRVRCRVCTNQIFFSKRCFKNIKAHRVFGLGLVGSVALHAIIFTWFRCMYCGTAIRLKYTNKAEPVQPRRH